MLNIYNTLSKSKEVFTPLDGNKVRMYVCGMTVYDYCHLGHGRSMVAFDLVTRWLAASQDKLLVDMPKGRQARPADMVELNTGFAQALQLLTDFYQHSGKADPTATLQALRDHLEQVAYHQHNVAAFTTPELEF